MAWPDDSAGALMTPEVIAINPDIRVDQAIDALRQIAREADVTHDIFVVDRDDTLLGVLPLASLVLAPSSTPVRLIMTTHPIAAMVTDDKASAAAMLRDNDLRALPVTDDTGHLLGVITHDDAIDILEAELTEDLLKLAGTDADEMARRTPLQIARLRLP
jgi:magnesium transporter